MAYSLSLPPQLAKHWTVKIRDRERVEPPHVTLLRGTRAWRLDLRTGEFLDDEPDPRDVSKRLIETVRGHWQELCAAWDRMYPENPVGSGEERDDE
jgi:hypothetical protein